MWPPTSRRHQRVFYSNYPYALCHLLFKGRFWVLGLNYSYQTNPSLLLVMFIQESDVVHTNASTFANALYMRPLVLCMPDSKDHPRGGFQALWQVNTGETWGEFANYITALPLASGGSSKIAKMKEALLKQHPLKPYIYLPMDNLLKLISIDLLTRPESLEAK